MPLLDSAFSFYLGYHSNPTNQLIHIICVWPILITAQIFFAYTTNLLPMLPFAIANNFPSNFIINSNTLLSLIYIVLYAIIEQPVGLFAALLVLLSSLRTNQLVAENPEVWKVALVIHVGCWIAQVYGHQRYEKRSPALLDNLFGALFMAPLFVLMEVLFSLGYRKEFKESMQKLASEDIRKFKQSQKNK